MAISFINAGSVAIGANNATTPQTLNPGAPASAENGDILVMVTISTKIDSTCSTPTGWNLVAGFPVTSGTASGGRIYVFTRVMDGGANDGSDPTWSTLTTGTSGSHIKAVILAYRGMTETLDGSLPTLADTTATTTTTIPAFSTGTAGSMVIGIAVKWRDIAGTSTTATFTERVDSQSTNAAGGELAISDILRAATGSSGSAAVTWSNTVSARTIAISIGFKKATETVFGQVVMPTTVNEVVTGRLVAYGAVVSPWSFDRVTSAYATGFVRLSLAAGSTPTVDTRHVIKIRARTTTGSTGRLEAALFEGSTNRSGWLTAGPLTTAFADYTFAIPEAAAATITSYADLEIRFRGIASTALVFRVALVELDVPEGAAGPTTWYGITQSVYTVEGVVSGRLVTLGAIVAPFTFVRVTGQKLIAKGRTLGGVTNRITNGGFETNATNWFTHGSAGGATIARDTAEHQFGVASGKVTPAGGASYQGAQFNVAASPEQVWTGSLYIKASAPKQMLLQVWYLDSGFGFLSNNYVSFASTTSWQRQQITVTVPAGAAAYIALAIETNEDTTAPWYIDGAQLERGAVANAYVETDGAPVASFAMLDRITQGRAIRRGAVVSPFSFVEVTAQKVLARGAVVMPTVFGAVTAQKLIARAAVAQEYTFGRVVSGRRSLASAVASPFTFVRVTGQKLIARSSVVTPITFGEVVSGGIIRSGAVVLALLFERVVSGRNVDRSSVVTQLTFGATTQGRVIAKGKVDSSFTAQRVVQGHPVMRGAVVLALTFNRVVRALQTARVAQAFSFTAVTAGRVVARGAVVAPFLLERVVSGRAIRRGAVAAAFAFGSISQARVVARSALAAPFTFSATTAARLVAKAQTVVPFVFGAVTQARGIGGRVTQAFSFGRVVTGRLVAKGAVSLEYRQWVDGTSITSAQLSNSNYTGLVEAYFGSLTPEWEMQWGQIEPTQGNFNWTQVDAIRTYANAHGLEMRGHCLVWDAAGNTDLMPTWVTGGSWTRTTLLAALEAHITAVVNRYKDTIRVWNCVNEAFEDDGSRTSWVFQAVIGDDWIEKAFEYAHAADPTAILLYNDYGIDWGYFGGNAKYTATLAMLTDFVGRGIPVHGVGIQGHYDLQYASYPHPVDYPAVLQTYRDLGLLVEVTELDCRIDNVGGVLQDKLRLQAGVYELARKGLQQVNGDHVTVWGLSDATNWLGSGAAAAPFDASYAEKPAWRKIKPDGALTIATSGRAVRRGAVVASFLLSRVTQARVTLRSSVVAPFVFGAVTAGRAARAGVVAAAFAFGAISQARVSARGVVAAPFAFVATTTGRLTAKAQTVFPIIFGAFAQAGAGGGAVAQAFSFGRVVAGKVVARSAIVTPLTFERVTQARLVRHGASILPLLFERVITGRNVDRATIVTPVTFGAITQGRVVAKSQVALPVIFAAVTQSGSLGGRIAQAFSFERVVQGVRQRFGRVDLPVTFGELVDGEVIPGSEVIFGAVAQTYTFERVTQARVVEHGQVVSPFFFGETVEGTLVGVKTGTVVLALTVNRVTQAKLVVKSRLDLPLALARVTQGRVGAKGQIVLPITFVRVTEGSKVGIVSGSVVLQLQLNEVVQGRPIRHGQIILPVTFSETVLGHPVLHGAIALPIAVDVAERGIVVAMGRVSEQITWQVVSVAHITQHGAVVFEEHLEILVAGHIMSRWTLRHAHAGTHVTTDVGGISLVKPAVNGGVRQGTTAGGGVRVRSRVGGGIR